MSYTDLTQATGVECSPILAFGNKEALFSQVLELPTSREVAAHFLLSEA
ncbi:hypothetical protein MHB77_06005 [Paenibacillus sp. FSL K6-3166]|nr:hypothetical protein [Paenibacillus sp. VTT E-133291]